MNKIISMSVWGDNPRYITGARRQIELAKKYYPDWKIRIYSSEPKNVEHLKSDTVEIHTISDGSYGMFWRFLPMFESPDNIVMVRDSDSRITIREADCIKEWLSSDKPFHTFKDHEAHYEFPIIGCAFGFKGVFDNETLRVMLNYMNEHKYYLSDQFFLRDYIWPLVKDNSLIHSMNEDGWFKESREKLKNKFSFCGNGYDENDMPLYPNSLENIESFDSSKLSEEYKFDEGVLE